MQIRLGGLQNYTLPSVVNIFRNVKDGMTSMRQQQDLDFYQTESRDHENVKNAILAIKNLMDGSSAE